MIYTIGYQRLTADELQGIVAGLGATLVDCRSKPLSRKAGFGWKQLTARFGSSYVKAGDILGGFGNTLPQGISWLTERAWHSTLLLMCMEEAPGECHRHSTVCWPAFPHAIHIYQDELVTAAALQAAIDADSDYEISGSLRDLLRKSA